MRAVFVSYRRGDTEGQARALCNELEELVGRDSVFMDVDSIELGRDFREVLQERLQACDQMLALIGPRWLDAKDAAGSRRLDQASDFVRQEIAAALKRKIPVTPLLVQGAQMPAPEQLPEELKELAFRNGFELSHNRWESDLNELVRRLGLRRADTRGDLPRAGAAPGGADALGVKQLEQAKDTTREPVEPVRARSTSLSRWLGWRTKLALIVLLGGFVLAMIGDYLDESSQEEVAPQPPSPAAGSSAPTEPRPDATAPPLAPQAGPEEAKVRAVATTIVGLIGDGKFNTLYGTYASDSFKQHFEKETTIANWTSGRAPLGPLKASRIIEVRYFPQSAQAGDRYGVRFRNDYAAASWYDALTLTKDRDGKFRLWSWSGVPVPRD